MNNGSLQLLDDDSQKLEFVATIDPNELPKLKELGLIDIDEESVSGYVVKHSEPLLLSNAWADSRFGKRQEQIATEKGVVNRSGVFKMS